MNIKISYYVCKQIKIIKGEQMKRIIFSILLITSILNIASATMSREEFTQALQYCGDGNKNYCKYLINNTNLKTPQQCDKDKCAVIGSIYQIAGYMDTAIEYYKRVVSLGDENGINWIGDLYYGNKDYINAKKSYELAAKAKDKKVRALGLKQIGFLYHDGFGVRQDYKKAFENFKKSCDIGAGEASGASCAQVGLLYLFGFAVKKNLSVAKEYIGKGCDLGFQPSCETYKELNKQGIK